MGIELITILISGGGAAMLLAFVSAWRALKAGATADEKDHIEMSEDRRRVAEVDRDAAITVAHYWRQRAGILEYLLVKHQGQDAVPDFPPEPKLVFALVEGDDTHKAQASIPALPGLPKIEGGS